jgi:hypothetical protein
MPQCVINFGLSAFIFVKSRLRYFAVLRSHAIQPISYQIVDVRCEAVLPFEGLLCPEESQVGSAPVSLSEEAA